MSATICLRKVLQLQGPILMYVGNLERYQGIDLLLESFKLTLASIDNAQLVIVGGTANDIERYEQKAQRLKIGSQVHFIGPRPLQDLKYYLEQADILVSPRIQGRNTPMKLYSYLDSGRPIVATDLPTHSQVLNWHIAWLAEPNPEGVAQGLVRLLDDPQLRQRMAQEAQAFVHQHHTFEVFSQTLTGLYDWLQSELVEEAPKPALSTIY